MNLNAVLLLVVCLQCNSPSPTSLKFKCWVVVPVNIINAVGLVVVPGKNNLANESFHGNIMELRSLAPLLEELVEVVVHNGHLFAKFALASITHSFLVTEV